MLRIANSGIFAARGGQLHEDRVLRGSLPAGWEVGILHRGASKQDRGGLLHEVRTSRLAQNRLVGQDPVGV